MVYLHILILTFLAQALRLLASLATTPFSFGDSTTPFPFGNSLGDDNSGKLACGSDLTVKYARHMHSALLLTYMSAGSGGKCGRSDDLPMQSWARDGTLMAHRPAT